MRELEDIFHKLSRAGHDVSAAKRDFLMLEHFVSQLASSQKQRSHPSPPSSSYAYVPSKSYSYQPHVPVPSHPHYQQGGHHHHQRASSLPTSVSSSHEQSRSISGPVSVDRTPKHRPLPLPLPSRSSPQTPAQAKGFAPGSTSSSSSPPSSLKSSLSGTLPAPNRKPQLPRRHSAPASMPAKRVHWATHATVYTFVSEAPAFVPPPRPSCGPRASSQSNSGASHDGR